MSQPIDTIDPHTLIIVSGNDGHVQVSAGFITQLGFGFLAANYRGREFSITNYILFAAIQKKMHEIASPAHSHAANLYKVLSDITPVGEKEDQWIADFVKAAADYLDAL